MVDYEHHQSLVLLETVDEESEVEDDVTQDDVRSNSSTLKSSSRQCGWNERHDAAGQVKMTESTDSGLESDKNVDTDVTTDNCSRRRHNENMLYHCQVVIYIGLYIIL